MQITETETRKGREMKKNIKGTDVGGGEIFSFFFFFIMY
jgi:hypothetical protein